MKTAEREINRLTYAFDILEDAKFPVIRVPKKTNKKNEEEIEVEEEKKGLDREALIKIKYNELPDLR